MDNSGMNAESTAPVDVRTVEDLIAAGHRALIKSARSADEAPRQAIEHAADWLYTRARELRG